MIRFDTNFVLHDFLGVRNVTITLPDEVALQARIWAAEADTSVSQFLGRVLVERMERESGYEQSRRQFLFRSPVILRENPQSYANRDDIKALLAWLPLAATSASISKAWEIEDRCGLSWWGSLIVASALQSQCAILFSEDMQDGLQIDGLRICNPLIPGFDVTLLQ